MENKLNLTPEQLEQAKTANSAEALLSLAQENGIAMTCEQAAEYYAELHAQVGVLSDEEMDRVSGGELSIKEYTELIAEFMNKYCHSCRYYKASRSLDIQNKMFQHGIVCNICPNITTFNHKSQSKGYRCFRRAYK